MKIGIMSDSHDNLPLIDKAVEVFNREEVDLVLHAGDFVSPFTASVLQGLNTKLVGVFGNNDGDKRFLLRRFKDIAELHDDHCELEIEGKRIALMHQPTFLEALVASGRYDLIVYGHTHQIDVRREPTVVVNPGECGGWTSNTSTIATVDLDSMMPEVFTL